MLTNIFTYSNFITSYSGLFSDFDGTLSNIEKNPIDVTINKKCQIALISLSKHIITGIVSGRPVDNVKEVAGIKNIYYVGNHGAEIIKPCVSLPQHFVRDSKEFNDCYELFVFPKAKKAAPYIKNISKIIKDSLTLPIEFDLKKYSASVHYRNYPQPAEAKRKIYNLLKNYLSNDLLEINDGRMVVEIRIKGINKATALKKIIEDEGLTNFIYFGDDSTDIDVFKMNKPKHLNFVVKNTEVRPDIYKYADFLLSGPDEVAKVLFEFLKFSDTKKLKRHQSQI